MAPSTIRRHTIVCIRRCRGFVSPPTRHRNLRLRSDSVTKTTYERRPRRNRTHDLNGLSYFHSVVIFQTHQSQVGYQGCVGCVLFKSRRYNSRLIVIRVSVIRAPKPATVRTLIGPEVAGSLVMSSRRRQWLRHPEQRDGSLPPHQTHEPNRPEDSSVEVRGRGPLALSQPKRPRLSRLSCCNGRWRDPSLRSG